MIDELYRTYTDLKPGIDSLMLLRNGAFHLAFDEDAAAIGNITGCICTVAEIDGTHRTIAIIANSNVDSAMQMLRDGGHTFSVCYPVDAPDTPDAPIERVVIGEE